RGRDVPTRPGCICCCVPCIIWNFPFHTKQCFPYVIAQKFLRVTFLQVFPRIVCYHMSQRFYNTGEDHMNRYMQEKWPWIEGTHGMRSQLTDILSDADLAFNPGGQNMTLGMLLREIGEIEHSYIQSLQT